MFSFQPCIVELDKSLVRAFKSQRQEVLHFFLRIKVLLGHIRGYFWIYALKLFLSCILRANSWESNPVACLQGKHLAFRSISQAPEVVLTIAYLKTSFNGQELEHWKVKWPAFSKYPCKLHEFQ